MATEAGAFCMPQAASARTAKPGSWWWSAHGNIRIRCPLCLVAYRLEIRHRDILADGLVPYYIHHRVKGCRERYVIMRLKGWAASGQDPAAPARS